MIYCVPDACLISGCVSGCLPYFRMCFRMLALGSALLSCLRRVKDLEKNTFSGLGLGILPPAGQRSQTKHVPGQQKHTYITYTAHIRPYSPISGPYRPLFAPGPL